MRAGVIVVGVLLVLDVACNQCKCRSGSDIGCGCKGSVRDVLVKCDCGKCDCQGVRQNVECKGGQEVDVLKGVTEIDSADELESADLSELPHVDSVEGISEVELDLLEAFDSGSFEVTDAGEAGDWADAHGGPVQFEPCGPALGNGNDDVPMCFVPAGEFVMGSDEGECEKWGFDCATERPQHIVYLDAFYIDQVEVRLSKYLECMYEGVCPEPSMSRRDKRGDPYGPDDEQPEEDHCVFGKMFSYDVPVNCVDWFAAKIYCEWAGKRLCTEAEWEKAASGPTHRLWPWGDEWHTGWSNCAELICADGYEDVAPVGSFPWAASPYGVLNLAGNVMEFVNDWADPYYYANSPYENPKGPCDGELVCLGYTDKVLRGSSWRETLVFPVDLGDFVGRVSHRIFYPPSGGYYDDVGFRCCISADEAGL